MTAGMADVIAAHWAQEVPSTEGRMFALRCQSEGCGWGGEFLYTDHAAHVAEELAKAGFGNVQEAGQQLQGATKKLRDANRKLRQLKAVVEQASLYGSVECDELDAIIDGVWSPAPDPLAAAMADPEGRALVQAIHDRKAEK